MIVGRHFSELSILQSILSEIPTIEIIASAESAAAAFTCLKNCQPELVVLDSRILVEMALEILEHVSQPVRVIFGSVLYGIGFRAFDVREYGSFLHPIDQVGGNAGLSLQQKGGSEYFNSKPR